jgi:hypothetical protein
MRSLTLLRGLFLAVVTVATGTLFFSVPAAADSTPFGFYQNDRVRVSPYHSLNTRTYAGTQYSLIATIPADTYGTVQAGPVITSTYVWWRVAFDNGKTGWSVQAEGTEALLLPVPPKVGIHSSTGGVDEGDTTWTFLSLDKPVNYNVTVQLSTMRRLHEANYPVQDDYAYFEDKVVTIPAGQTFKLVPVQVYRNEGQYEDDLERFEICIDAAWGADVNRWCELMTIYDVPTTPTVNASTTLFGDAIGTGWWDASYGVTQNQAAGYDASGVAVNHTNDWTGLSFESGGVDTADYDTLSFAAKGSATNNGSVVYVVVYLDSGAVNSVLLANYLPEWQPPVQQLDRGTHPPE